jgi:hypothetical protein
VPQNWLGGNNPMVKPTRFISSKLLTGNTVANFHKIAKKYFSTVFPASSFDEINLVGFTIGLFPPNQF